MGLRARRAASLPVCALVNVNTTDTTTGVCPVCVPAPPGVFLPEPVPVAD